MFTEVVFNFKGKFCRCPSNIHVGVEMSRDRTIEYIIASCPMCKLEIKQHKTSIKFVFQELV